MEQDGEEENNKSNRGVSRDCWCLRDVGGVGDAVGDVTGGVVGGVLWNVGDLRVKKSRRGLKQKGVLFVFRGTESEHRSWRPSRNQ